MRKILLASTALAALLFAPLNTDMVAAQSDKPGNSGNAPGHDSGGPGGRENAPGHDSDGPGNSENAGQGSGGSADAPGHDPDGPGESENAPGHNKTENGGGNGDDEENGEDDEENGEDNEANADNQQRVNPVAVLNSPKKLSDTIDQVRDLDLTDIQVVTFDDQELDVALKGGSARAIQNAVARQLDTIEGLLTPEELAFLNEELSGIEVENIVGFAVEDDTLIVYVRS